MHRASSLALALALAACAHPAPAPEAARAPEPAAAPAPSPADAGAAIDAGAPLPESALGDATRGHTLFGNRCASCHGPTGKGDGEEAMYYTPPPRDLGSPAMKAIPDAEIFETIRKGTGNMPPFAAKLSESETWDLVAYLRTLQR